MRTLHLTLQEVQRLAGEAWSESFVAVLQGVPHPDDDPEGTHYQAAQRRLYLSVMGEFGAKLVDQGVSAGLWVSADAFWAEFDQAEARLGGES